MKKKNLTSLALNKRKISQLQEQSGGAQDNGTDQITMSTCTCITCLPFNCPGGSITCPPKPTDLCTIDCTIDCSIFTCPIPTGNDVP
ncbi:MAG: hypothetical protein AB8B65_07610 [Kordia sp.]|uniref:hypothetical protein n=1 Tax=Kordia sp. TaxID=1965332 RepID=UPI00385C1E05